MSNNEQKNKAAELFYLTWVGFIYQMSIFGEGRVQCMKVSKKRHYIGQKTQTEALVHLKHITTFSPVYNGWILQMSGALLQTQPLTVGYTAASHPSA